MDDPPELGSESASSPDRMEATVRRRIGDIVGTDEHDAKGGDTHTVCVVVLSIPFVCCVSYFCVLSFVADAAVVAVAAAAAGSSLDSTGTLSTGARGIRKEEREEEEKRRRREKSGAEEEEEWRVMGVCCDSMGAI